MERRISPDDLILPRPTCEVAQKGIVNGLIFSQYRQAVAMEDLDEAFYESVSHSFGLLLNQIKEAFCSI